MSYLLLGLSAAVLVLAVFGFVWAGKTPQSRRAIIAQYAPPSGLSVLSGALVADERRRSIAAQLVDLSVRKAINILAPESPGEPYRVELRDSSAAKGPIEIAVIRAIFGSYARPGTIVRVNNRNAALKQRLMRAQGLTSSLAVSDGLVAATGNSWRGALVWVQVALVVMLGLWLSGWIVLGFVFGIITLVLSRLRRSALTEKGVEVRDHLAGLKLFISVAEKDRIQMLQSPTGALKQGDLFLLYEKLLGWATLFGMGREWARVLELQAQEIIDSGGYVDTGVFDTFVLISFASTFDFFADSDASGEISDTAGDTGSGNDFGDVSSGGFFSDGGFGDSGGDSGGGGDGGGGGGD